MEPIFPSAPAPDLPPHLRWRTIKVRPGIHSGYMLAGAPVGVICHFSGSRTLPCVAKLTNGQMSCPLCKKPKRFVCYVPLLSLTSKKNRQHVIQGAKRTHESCSGIAAGELVNVFRGNAERDTPVIQKATSAPIGVDLTTLRKKTPYDITRYLLHLWQWRELTERFGEHHFASARSLEIEDGKRTTADDPPREYEEE